MEQMGQDLNPEKIKTDRKEVFFRYRYNSSVVYTIALLLFFLPFAELKCGNMAILGNTGIGIATGQEWKFSSEWKDTENFRGLRNSGNETKKMLRDTPNIFAIAAMAAALFGIFIPFSRENWRSLAGMSAGLLGAVMLVALLIQFRIDMRKMIPEAKTGDDHLGLDLGGVFSLKFTIWFYVSLSAFIAGAFLNYIRDRLALRDAMESSVDFEFQQKEKTTLS